MARLPIRLYDDARLGRVPAGDLVRTPRFVPMIGPGQALVLAATLASLGYIYREEISQVAQELTNASVDDTVMAKPAAITKAIKGKRTLSKANKAMKQAMKATKNNFKLATKIASKANPGTKSRIGKGASKIKKLARKIRKSVWGSLRRKK